MLLITSVIASKKHHENCSFLKGDYGFRFLFGIILCYFSLDFIRELKIDFTKIAPDSAINSMQNQVHFLSFLIL